MEWPNVPVRADTIKHIVTDPVSFLACDFTRARTCVMFLKP